jgi:hypothetical protein
LVVQPAEDITKKADAQNLTVLKHMPPSISSGSTPSNEKEASKHEDSSPPLPIPIAPNYSDSDNVHEIAPTLQPAPKARLDAMI